VDVWFDEWELAPGDSLHECIGNALSTVAYVGVVLSPASVKSNWCHSELLQGLAREKRTGSKVVIPLLYKRVPSPPFLEDRLYPNFSTSYMAALAQLAALIHQLPQRELAEGLAEARPKTIAQVKTLLESIGWEGVRYISAADYETLRRILKRSGVSLTDDEFDFVPLSSQSKTTATREKGRQRTPTKKKASKKRMRRVRMKK